MSVRPTNPTRHHGSIAFRVGLCFLVVSVGVWAASLLTPDSIDEDPRPAQSFSFSSPMIPWALVSGLVTIGGIASIYSLSSLACIERQLIQASVSPKPTTNQHPGEVDAVGGEEIVLAPIIGNDPAVRGYNALLQATQRSRHPVANRSVSQLDDAAITHARAMRVLDTAWVITDEGGVIRYNSPKAKGLLNLVEQTQSSLFDLLQIDEPELIDRLLSRVRIVRISVKINLNTRETHLDVVRSRLRGRDGDCEGMAWLIEDRTAQTQAIRSRDDFLMAATHELRTPLTNMRAYAEALAAEEGVEIEDQKQFCNVIVSESVRMGRLVDQLLSMGQIEAGSLVIENREVDLHQLLGDVQSQVLGQAEEKHQTIQMEIADKLPTVIGDADHLRSAINNLVGNAVKYTPEHGIIIIRCHHPDPKPERETSASRSFVCIEIIDNGPGIAEEDHSRIFEKFYRCQDSAASQRGNGLGLSLAQEVARLHGGDIRLESQPGQGSHFILELPATGVARSGLGH
ncbi:sensor histidine kinase [Neorhodopirellula pilleata]|uniref:histidine kinase n=1 Tax=Neorhodopirellula pilleata TaxID=2714738 RepID=A0A5C6AI23_9BACT|nr:HAMP domain-containing sensor histidine kinase [Neorhodopirellula pilleata]TWT98701.1 Alkaline phosphatase synthesis sensor protein PhoR [Neorhodopirellula pilleata]